MPEQKRIISVSFVAASSNSGKTTLIEKIVRLLKERGLRVAVIKHAPKGFDLDRPGKDSWRFEQAGADSVVLVGPGRLAVLSTTDHEPEAEELERFVTADIVIYEGFREKGINRIEVFRSGISGERPLCMTDSGFIALASDKRFDVPVPVFGLNDAQGVADFLLRKISAR